MAVIEYIKELFGGKNFARFSLGWGWSAFGMAVIWYLITNELTGSMKEFGNTVLGFVMGTIVGSIIQFYFGTSQSSSEKDEIIKKLSNDSKPDTH